MKKGFLKLSVLFVALFVGIIGAKADIFFPSEEQCTIETTTDEHPNGSCNLRLMITDSSTISKGYTFDVTVKNPSNIVNNEVTINPQSDWTITTEVTSLKFDITSGVTLTFKYNGDADLTAANSGLVFATGTYKKDDAYAENCGFGYGNVVKACEVREAQDGTKYYFGKDGEQTTEDQYYKDCFSCKYDAESGKYYGLDGKETDEATYNKECKNICRKENGKYYCKDGNECTKEDYDNECPENTKTGAFLPVAGIIAGVALIGVSTIMVRRQTKLRRL
ncbi:MAG: hypothetical protein IKX00_01860 [Bacilli bacterium]|nr:hypothetical protein [Bacilli bacterium]